MPFDDDVLDDSDREFVREAFTVRIVAASTGELLQTLEFPELRIPASERREEEQG